jgi:demethylmenaquinone methyltransferase/2-methoxy-6-polyprenyl-1,4-benzoquinol methylase
LTIDTSRDPSRIAGMFDAIARRYDLLNHLLSGGLDVYWRRRALRALAFTGDETLLDVCTGTADVALGAARHGRARRVIGVDFAGAMLALGYAKTARAGLAARITLIRGDALRLPIRDGSVDGVTIAFGIRNVADPQAACRELWRALKPDGRLAILEFAMPPGRMLRAMYAAYFRFVLPVVGGAVSGHPSAYAYLPASVREFPEPPGFVTILKSAGFVAVEARPLTFGTVQLYVARRPGDNR